MYIGSQIFPFASASSMAQHSPDLYPKCCSFVHCRFSLALILFKKYIKMFFILIPESFAVPLTSVP